MALRVAQGALLQWETASVDLVQRRNVRKPTQVRASVREAKKENALPLEGQALSVVAADLKAGAHGELAGILVIRAYHLARGDAIDPPGPVHKPES